MSATRTPLLQLAIGMAERLEPRQQNEAAFAMIIDMHNSFLTGEDVQAQYPAHLDAYGNMVSSNGVPPTHNCDELAQRLRAQWEAECAASKCPDQ